MTRGRKPIGERAMTAAERKRRQRKMEATLRKDPRVILERADALIEDSYKLMNKSQESLAKVQAVLNELKLQVGSPKRGGR